MTSPTPDQLAKLPKWAQEHIVSLARQRKEAVDALNAYCDASTPSSFAIDEMECTGEKAGPSTKRRFVQTHKVTVTHLGVELQVNTHSDEGIQLQWGGVGHTLEHVAFVPSSFQSATLVPRSHMRD